MTSRDLLLPLKMGGKPALARILSDAARLPLDPGTATLLDAAHDAPKGRVIGLTGPPGVGKSTLAGLMIRHWRAGGLSVGVIAVDPSSRLGGGAMLGDRIRLDSDPEDRHLFIRSQAAGTMLGGLATDSFAAMVIMRALYDRVLIETVGIGQSETGLRDLADSLVMLLQPGSGDALQFLKAGIMEIPDLFLIGKSDIGAAALRAEAEVSAALELQVREGTWRPPVLRHSAATGHRRINDLIEALDRHWSALLRNDGLGKRRRDGSRQAMIALLRERLGSVGIAKVAPHFSVGTVVLQPFAALTALLQSPLAR